MTDPTPQSNLNKITEVKGEVNALGVKIEAHMRSEKESAEVMSESAKNIAESVKSLTDKTSRQIDRIFGKTDIHGAEITGLKARFNGAEKLAETRNWTIHEKMNDTKKAMKDTISEGFKNVEKLIAAKSQLANAGAANAKESAKNSWSNTKWIIGVLITLFLALGGWVVAFLS